MLEYVKTMARETANKLMWDIVGAYDFEYGEFKPSAEAVEELVYQEILKVLNAN
jgi:hypothetical protein